MAADVGFNPRTDAGDRLALACEVAVGHFSHFDPAKEAEGAWPADRWARLREGGVLGGCVPTPLGGFGVETLEDIVVAVDRVGRADPAVAIGFAMQLTMSWVGSRMWRHKLLSGAAYDFLTALLRECASKQLLIASPFSERGTHRNFPLTEARRVEEGYCISGHKVFGTNSPGADFFVSSVRIPDGDGQYLAAVAIIPAGTPGLTVLDNWDALGMRRSGSNDVVYEECIVPHEFVIIGGSWGHWNAETAPAVIVNGYGLVGAYVGIAEHARELAIAAVCARRKGPSGRLLGERRAIQAMIAEMEVHVSVCQAMAARGAQLVDSYLSTHDPDGLSEAALDALMKDCLCSQTEVKRRAAMAVDCAMTASGGGSFMSASPLAQLYRDVRAGSFMQLYGPGEDAEFIGKVVLGLPLDLDL